MQHIAIVSALLAVLVGVFGCMEKEGLNARDAGGSGGDVAASSPDVSVSSPGAPVGTDAADDSPVAVDAGAVDVGVDVNVSDSAPRDGVASAGDVATPALLYTASALIGALDRILINVTDREKNRCLRMVLLAPSVINRYMVDVPKPFVLDIATLFDSSACSQMAVPFGGAPAISGTGSISWPAIMRVYPCSLNIHASFTFRAIESAPPIMIRLDADAVPVVGCN